MYLTITNVFYFPLSVDVIYSKALDWIKVNKYILEETKQDDYIKFRIVAHRPLFGDYKRTSTIFFSKKEYGVEVKVTFPRPKADDIPFHYPYYLNDVMFSFYKYLYGEPTKSILSEIYPLYAINKSINSMILDSIGISSPWLIILFLFLMNDSNYIGFSILYFVPWFVLMREVYKIFKAYYKIKKETQIN